jgi:hypothetical protein
MGMKTTCALVIAAATFGCGSSTPATFTGDAPAHPDAPTSIDGPPPGNIHFRPAVSFGTGPNPAGVALADLDGDGRLDIVVGDRASDLVSVLINTTAAGSTTPSFADHADFATGDTGSGAIGSPAVAVADLDGDGRPDVVAGNSRGALSVLMNATVAGSSALAFAAHADVPSIENATSIAVDDFNADGKPDLAVIAGGPTGTSATVSVFLDTTTGSTPAFAPRLDITTGADANHVVAADVNGDALPDLVVSNGVASKLSILTNTTAPSASAATFAKSDLETANGPVALASADFNGDGKPDLAAAEVFAGGAAVEVFLDKTASEATPTFATTGAQAAEISVPLAIAASDLDGDGKPDLVIVGDDQVSVWLDTTPPNTSAVTFAGHVDFSDSGPIAIAVGDLNGDGKPDLVMSSSTSDTVSVLLAE